MGTRLPEWYRALLAAGLTMAIALALVSVHLRLASSGLGCADWPQCYGRIGTGISDVVFPDNGTRFTQFSHRILASMLGIVVLLVFTTALRQKRERVAASMLFLVTLVLAALGKHSAGLERPAVVMTNYSGGILLVALFWWMLICSKGRSTAVTLTSTRWALFSVLALTIQLLSGGLVSAYFAGVACGASINCNGSWIPSIPWGAFSMFFDRLALDDNGRVIIGQSLTGLHMAHRMGGAALVALLSWLAWSVHISGRTALACTILGLAATTGLVGAFSVKMNLSPELVMTHYILALALLLSVLTAVTDHPHRTVATPSTPNHNH